MSQGTLSQGIVLDPGPPPCGPPSPVAGGSRRRLFLAIGVVAGIALGAEIALERHYYHGRTYNYYDAAEVYWEDQSTLLLYIPHRELFWTLKPNVRMRVAEKARSYGLQPDQNGRIRHEWEIRVGKQGFRGDDFPVRKPPGELRVACFGDSRTIGEGLEEHVTYPARLEALLRRANVHRPVRVLNLGADGWSSHQGLTLLRTRALSFEPDVAVFAFGINDADMDWDLSDRAKARSLDSPMVTLQRTLYRSTLFYWLQRQYLGVKAQVFGKTRVRRTRGVTGARVRRVSPEQYAANVRGFAALCRERRILPIVLIVPANPYRSWNDDVTLREPGANEDQLRKLGAVMESYPPGEAIAAVEGMLRADPGFHVARHALASLHRDQGDLSAADELFSSLAESSVFHRYNRAARSAAWDAVVVDLTEAFHERRHEPLFIDAVHPSYRGAELIARELLQAIQVQLAIPRALADGAG